MILLQQRGSHAQRFQVSDVEFGFRSFLDPNNPFLPWILLFDLLLLLLHLYAIFWVYRDALSRYNRGAPWAALTAIFPFGGWLFYMLYRNSKLVEYDRIEAETFEEDEPEWTDYDRVRADQSTKWFRDVRALWAGGEAEGYSPWVRASRLREQRRTLTPLEKEARRQQRIQERAERKLHAGERRKELQHKRKMKRKANRAERTKTGAHGFTFSMSRRRQKRIERDLSIVDQLKQLPREDQLVEELIYEMDYVEALKASRDGLDIASEMGDRQGEITYRTYIERIERMLLDETDEFSGTADDNPAAP